MPAKKRKKSTLFGREKKFEAIDPPMGLNLFWVIQDTTRKTVAKVNLFSSGKCSGLRTLYGRSI
jgi:hypothetical protein